MTSTARTVSWSAVPALCRRGPSPATSTVTSTRARSRHSRRRNTRACSTLKSAKPSRMDSNADPTIPPLPTSSSRPQRWMGIDIGDLSHGDARVAPRDRRILERVGRAGRRTGNALNLAIVGSTNSELRTIHDPLFDHQRMFQPPATYLDAVEIIKRQYLAFLGGRVRAGRSGLETRCRRCLRRRAGQITELPRRRHRPQRPVICRATHRIPRWFRGSHRPGEDRTHCLGQRR